MRAEDIPRPLHFAKNVSGVLREDHAKLGRRDPAWMTHEEFDSQLVLERADVGTE
jgi:hypothetical protein